MGTLKEHGASIVTITPQLPEASRSLVGKQRISFDLLSDPGNEYAVELGLRFELPDDLKAVYLSFGNDLAVHNGESSWTSPMPGRFVVDRTGIGRAADVDPDYQYRPEPQKTVDDVRTSREVANVRTVWRCGSFAASRNSNAAIRRPALATSVPETAHSHDRA